MVIAEFRVFHGVISQICGLFVRIPIKNANCFVCETGNPGSTGIRGLSFGGEPPVRLGYANLLILDDANHDEAVAVEIGIAFGKYSHFGCPQKTATNKADSPRPVSQ